jgi:hypothetical protein
MKRTLLTQRFSAFAKGLPDFHKKGVVFVEKLYVCLQRRMKKLLKVFIRPVMLYNVMS